jgi:hypothetical protein
MHRRLATHLVALAVGLGAGVGTVALANDGGPPARSSAADTRIVNELRDINKTLKLVNKNLGGYDNIAVTPSIQDELQQICHNTTDRLSVC